MLKPGGSLYLDAPFNYVEHQIPHDYFRYTRYGLNHLCKEYGLDVAHLEPDCAGPITALRMMIDGLNGVISHTDENSEDYKIFADTLEHLKTTIQPMLYERDFIYQRQGVGDDIPNCSQYPVRYNLIATKPGKLKQPRHFASRAELLQDIAECPACHRSGLDWQAEQCGCPKCGASYKRNASGIPELFSA